MMDEFISDWDASAFFRSLTEANVFAHEHDFCFKSVSGLDGFLELISSALKMKAVVAVNDSSKGQMTLADTPHSRKVKSVFMFMRHKAGDVEARDRCLSIMNELFRQFMSVLIRERIKLREGCIYVDENISFNEIDRYFYTGGACAYFQIAYDKYVSLEYDPEEWLSPQI